MWYSEEGTGRGHSPPRPLLAISNVTAHPLMASVPINVLLCGFNMPIKGLKNDRLGVLNQRTSRRSLNETRHVQVIHQDNVRA